MGKNTDHFVTINVSRPRLYIHEYMTDTNGHSTSKKQACEKIKKTYDTTFKEKISSLSKVLKKDNLLLSYRLYAKKKKDITLKIARGTKLFENYKILNEDFHKRLRVEEVKPETDIDDGFFRYLKGHPSNQLIPLFKSLKFQFHQQLRMRQEVGYRRDIIFAISFNNKREMQKYQRCKKIYLAHLKNFYELIAKDYKKSIALVNNCEDLASELNDKNSQLHILVNQQFLIQSRLIVLDHLYFVQQKYGRFLYYLSPPSWRAKHRQFARSLEIEEKGFDLGSSSEEDMFDVIYKKMQNECYRGMMIKPVLFFFQPDLMIDVFRILEEQNCHHFAHVTLFAPQAKCLMMQIVSFKNTVKDTALLTHMIENFKKLVEFCDIRESQLQAKFMKILHGLFYDTVAATDVLKLQVDLGYCYEKLFPVEPINMNPITTAKALEGMYMKYSFKLEKFTNDKIKCLMKHYVDGERNKIKRARNAARELRLFNRLEHALLTDLKQDTKKDASQLLPIPAKKKFANRTKMTRHLSKPGYDIKTSNQHELTIAEIEYLALFTDWTENEDPAIYIPSLNITDRINSADN